MSMGAIRQSFFRAAKRQVHTAELGHPILRLLLGLALALDILAGHPLWLTVGIIGAIAAVFWSGAREIRRDEQSPPSDGATSPEEPQ